MTVGMVKHDYRQLAVARPAGKGRAGPIVEESQNATLTQKAALLADLRYQFRCAGESRHRRLAGIWFAVSGCLLHFSFTVTRDMVAQRLGAVRERRDTDGGPRR